MEKHSANAPCSRTIESYVWSCDAYATARKRRGARPNSRVSRGLRNVVFSPTHRQLPIVVAPVKLAAFSYLSHNTAFSLSFSFSRRRRLLFLLYPVFTSTSTRNEKYARTNAHTRRGASRRPSMPAGVSNRTAGVTRRWRRRGTPPPLSPPRGMRHNATATAFDRPPPFFLCPCRRVTNPLKTFRLEVRAFRSAMRGRTYVWGM